MLNNQIALKVESRQMKYPPTLFSCINSYGTHLPAAARANGLPSQNPRECEGALKHLSKYYSCESTLHTLCAHPYLSAA